MTIIDSNLIEGCKCKEVSGTDIINHSMSTVKDMITLMKEKRGIGLAAPQVGIFRKFFVMKHGNDYIACFNPKIIFKSPQKSAMKESCLSYPHSRLGFVNRPSVNIMRPKTIKVEFQDENKDIVTLKLRGTESKYFQHELDHLNGLTIFYRGEKK